MTFSLRCAAACAVAALLAAGAAGANDNNTKAVLGLDMSFGTKVTPEVFAGLEHANENSSGHYNGLKALAYWDFAQGFQPSKLKLLGILDGRRNWQPEVGVGYSLQTNGGFFTGGLSGQNFTGGVDFNPQTGLAPYVGVQLPKEP